MGALAGGLRIPILSLRMHEVFGVTIGTTTEPSITTKLSVVNDLGPSAPALSIQRADPGSDSGVAFFNEFDFMRARIGLENSNGTIFGEQANDLVIKHLIEGNGVVIGPVRITLNGGACIRMLDSDGSGYTYLTVLDGVPTFSTSTCE